ncbi:MAG: hypothetical protein HKN91_12455 [Acidimicrobiia bacterium]|nr:hypothetical protein [Acidimicrobiia bacterium]
MGTASGFVYSTRKNGEVEILHHGQPAVVLRGAKAAKFLRDVDHRDPQQLMARLTGNYKRGNEKR